jgi:hypothetical protein
VFGDVVDLEGGDDLAAVGALVRLVPQDRGTQGLPLGGAVPAAQGIVRPRMFSVDGVDLTASAGRHVGAARDDAQVRGARRHRRPWL